MMVIDLFWRKEKIKKKQIRQTEDIADIIHYIAQSILSPAFTSI